MLGGERPADGEAPAGGTRVDERVPMRIRRIRENRADATWNDVAWVFDEILANQKADKEALTSWQRERDTLILKLSRKVSKLKRRLEETKEARAAPLSNEVLTVAEASPGVQRVPAGSLWGPGDCSETEPDRSDTTRGEESVNALAGWPSSNVKSFEAANDGQASGLVADHMSDPEGDSVASSASDGSGLASEMIIPRKEPSEVEDMQITPTLLDIGDAYAAESSVWDGMVCFGTSAIGPTSSMILIGVWLINISLVVVFLLSVQHVFGEEQGVSSEILDGLLKFRLSVAHSADFADKVTRRSMAAQVCDGEFKLHIAGFQQNMYEELANFKEGGLMSKVLMILVQFIWAAVIMREFEFSFSFAAALRRVPRSSGWTKFTLVDLVADEVHGYQSALDEVDRSQRGRMSSINSLASLNNPSFGKLPGLFTSATASTAGPADAAPDDGEGRKGDDGEILQRQTPTNSAEFLLMKTIRVDSIYWPRYWLLLAFVCVPRMILAACLYWTGALWLASTIEMGDLILNSIALEFVLQFSGVLFLIAAPRRVKTLVSNLEAMPVHSKHVSGTTWELTKVAFKVCVITCVMVYLTLFHLIPIFNQLDQAEAVLCSGERHFIYTTNPATGMIHVARTSEETPPEFTNTEYVVGQVAKVDLLDDPAVWDDFYSSKVIEASRSRFTRAVVTPAAESLEEAELSPEAFAEIIQMSVWSTADAASVLPCADLAGGQSKAASLQTLRLIVGDESIQGCGDVPQERCAEMSLPGLRAICPKRCGCEQAMTNSVGFFGTPQFGCPRQCDTFKAATNEISYRFSFNAFTGVDRFDALEVETCDDLHHDEFGFAGGCVDADGDGYKTDRFLWGCQDYGLRPGDCDASGGDDVDFSAAVMCCQCGGGNREVPSSADCWEEWTPGCWSMPPKPRAWLLYLKGLFDFSLSQPGFYLTLKNVIQQDYAGLNTTDLLHPGTCNLTRSEPWLDAGDNAANLLEHISSAALGRVLANGTWEILPGKPHPRRTAGDSGAPLQGCDFLASYEITSLLNIDLCNPGDKTSIKFFCPRACGCSSSSALSECPAACILTSCSDETCRHVHPWYSQYDTLGEINGSTSSVECCDDTDNGAKGVDDYTCDEPPLSSASTEDDPKTDRTFCLGSFDDEDFSAWSMCCSCHGGASTDGNSSSNTTCFDNADGCPTAADKDLCGTSGYPAEGQCCVCGGGQSSPVLSVAFAVMGIDYASLEQDVVMLGSVSSSMAALMNATYEGARGEWGAPPASFEVRLSPGSLVVQITIDTHIWLPSLYYKMSTVMDRLTGETAFRGRVASSLEGVAGIDCCMTDVNVLPRAFFYQGDATVVDGFENVNTTLLQSDCCDCTTTKNRVMNGCEVLLSRDDRECTEGWGDDSDFTAKEMCCICSQESCEDMEFEALDSAGEGCALGYFFPDYCGNYDDTDFTASVLCCGCSGGALGGVWPLVPCDATDGSAPSSVYPCTCGGALCSMNEICEANSSSCVLTLCDSDDGSGFSSAYPCRCGTRECTAWEVCDASADECSQTNDVTFPHLLQILEILQLLPATPAPPPTPAPSPAPAPCVDITGRATDSRSRKCGTGYSFHNGKAYYCGTYDDSDFSSNVMCCVCGGGELGECLLTAGAAMDSSGYNCALGYALDHYCGGYDDSDFTASDMCCECSAGSIPE